MLTHRHASFQAEYIAERTGCYIYLASLHPASRSPYYSYVSPKLREKFPEGVKRIHAAVFAEMSALLRSNQTDRINAEAELAKKTEEVNQAMKLVSDTQAELQANRAAMETQKQEINALLGLVSTIPRDQLAALLQRKSSTST